MCNDTVFWCGMGVGLVAGTMMGITLSCGKRSMKTQVGKKIQQMGTAVDHTMDNLISRMR